MMVLGSGEPGVLPVATGWWCGGNQHVPVRQLVHPDDAQRNQKAQKHQQTATAAQRGDDRLCWSLDSFFVRPLGRPARLWQVPRVGRLDHSPATAAP